MHACNECMQRIHPASASPGILHSRARTSRSNFIAGQLAPQCPPSASHARLPRRNAMVRPFCARARVCVCVCVCARARDQLLWMNPYQDIVLARSSLWRRSGTVPFAATWVSSMVVVRGETADNDAGTDAKIGNRCSRRRVELISSTRAPQNPAEPTDPRWIFSRAPRPRMECISATVPTGHRLGMLYFGASCKARRAGSETSMSRRSSEVSDQPERQAKASKSN